MVPIAFIKFIDRECSEWSLMWQSLAKMEVNNDDPVCDNEETGDCWQYMGTFEKVAKVVHEFRHRRHPLTCTRMVIDIPVSEGWQP